MIEAATTSTEVIEHYGTWLTGPDGYSDFVLRGPRQPLGGLPGPLDVEGIIIPFSNFLPLALQWSFGTRCEPLEKLLSVTPSERILVGSFTWSQTTFLVSFIYFEDIPVSTFRERGGVSIGLTH
jgi:hypothetical protein